MNARPTRSFRKHFDTLPSDVRDQARKAYRLWQTNSAHTQLLTIAPILKGNRTATVPTEASISQRALPPFQLAFDKLKVLMPEHDARPE